MAQHIPTAFQFGKYLPLVEAIRSEIASELNIRHVFDSASDPELRRLRHLLVSEPAPDFIFTGLGFTPAEFEAIRSVPGGENVIWVYGNPKSTRGVVRTGPPSVEEVVGRLRKGIPEYLRLARERSEEGKEKGEKGGERVYTWWPVEEYTK